MTAKTYTIKTTTRLIGLLKICQWLVGSITVARIRKANSYLVNKSNLMDKGKHANLIQEYKEHKKTGQTFEVFFMPGYKNNRFVGRRRCLCESKAGKRRREADNSQSSQCENPAKKPTNACHKHGGSTPNGFDSVHTKTGEHSKYVNPYIPHLSRSRQKLLQESQETDLSLKGELEVIGLMIKESLSSTGLSLEQMYAALSEINKVSSKAWSSKDPKKFVEAVRSIKDIASIVEIDSKSNDKKTMALIAQKANLTKIEVGNIAQMESSIQISAVMMMFAQMMSSLKSRLLENVTDKKVVARIINGTREDIDAALPVYDEG